MLRGSEAIIAFLMFAKIFAWMWLFFFFFLFLFTFAWVFAAHWNERTYVYKIYDYIIMIYDDMAKMCTKKYIIRNENDSTRIVYGVFVISAIHPKRHNIARKLNDSIHLMHFNQKLITP